jgi:REP element-mobilizing transposase RayT
MPRVARIKSKSKIYHIMIRGINQQNIFSVDEDYKKFIAILAKYRKKSEYKIYAYCLMGNHAHLLIKEGKEALSHTMKRVGTSYVSWYNWQYNRKGHLFQDRYKSEPVEDDVYFLTVLRYIHQNPLKAGLANDISSYQWSSYNEYINQPKIVNIEFALKMFHQERDKAIERFKRFNQETNNDQCIEMPTKRKTLSDKEVRHIVLSKYHIELATLQNTPAIMQDKVLKYLKELDGCSLRQVSRLTGFTVNKIFKV